MLLALDTASHAVTVAVADSSGAVRAESSTVDARRHGELLAPAVESALREAGVDRQALTRVVVGTGPGPFTGLRVGLVTARMLGATLGVPVRGVCTLDVLALQAVEDDGALRRFRVVTDALRKEVHWAAYDVVEGRPVRTAGPHVARPADAAYDGPAVGAGATLYAQCFPDRRGPQLPSAAVLCRWIAHGLPTGEPEPLYLRRPDAAEPAGRKRVS